MTDHAILSPGYKITIPKHILEMRNWKPGEELAFVQSSLGIALVRVPTIDELRGIARGADPTGYRERSEEFR